MQQLIKVEPDIVSVDHEGDEVVLNMFVSGQLDYFKGHFPGAPILAGVVQLDWAVKYGKQYLQMPEQAVARLEVLKFQVVITPEMSLTLSFCKKAENKFTFKYESEKGTHASGRVLLEEL